MEYRYVWHTRVGSYTVIKWERKLGKRFYQVSLMGRVISEHDTSVECADKLRALGIPEEIIHLFLASAVAERLLGR